MGEVLSHCSDFGRKLEGLKLLLRISRIFCHSRMAKKGVCLARCTGELHPGPSGWLHENAEALDLLAFWSWNSSGRVLPPSGVRQETA